MKETSLAVVLSRMLRVPDTWEGFAEQYVRALDDCVLRRIDAPSRRAGPDRAGAASALAEWHGLLLENLVDTEGGLLDRIAGHAALGGGAVVRLPRDSRTDQATPTSRPHLVQCLQNLPGHKTSASSLPRSARRPRVSTACSATAGRARRAAGRRPCRAAGSTGGERVEELDQVGASGGVVGGLPRRVAVERGDSSSRHLDLVADELVEERGQLGVVGVERVLAGNWHLLGQLGGLAGVAQRAAGSSSTFIAGSRRASVASTRSIRFSLLASTRSVSPSRTSAARIRGMPWVVTCSNHRGGSSPSTRS